METMLTAQPLESSAIVPVEPETKLERSAVDLPARAKSLVVATAADEERAVELARAIKDLRAEAEAHHRPVIDAAHRAHKAACDALNKIDGPLKTAEVLVKSKIGEYRRSIEAAAEAERQRLLAEERERREQETEAAIVQAEQEGASVAEVDAIIDQHERMPMVAPTVAPPPKPKGMAVPKTYVADVTSKAEFLRWVASRPEMQHLVDVNEGNLTRYAAATKGAVKIPGVTVREQVGVRIGR